MTAYEMRISDWISDVCSSDLVRRPGDENHSPLDVRSQELTLLPDKDVVFTDLPALVVNGDSTMHGTGMRYDNKTSVLQVFSASDVKISGKDKDRKSDV